MLRDIALKEEVNMNHPNNTPTILGLATSLTRYYSLSPFQYRFVFLLMTSFDL